MNYHMIRYILGQIMKLEAALMGLPLLVSLYYLDEGMIPLLSVMLPLGILGYILTGFKPKKQDIYAREGFVIVAFAWILLSVFGALPFVIGGSIPSFTDALFETVSGFTTTGSTLLTDIESLPMSLLMWRSFTHWIGGMGVLVFALAILPAGSAQSMYIMRAEVPGPSVGKLVAKTQITARILYGIYVFFTALEAIMLRLTGMRWFDCIANAFATAGTGGFAVLNDGIGGYHNVWVEVIITVFMLVFSINFKLFLCDIHRLHPAHHLQHRADVSFLLQGAAIRGIHRGFALQLDRLRQFRLHRVAGIIPDHPDTADVLRRLRRLHRRRTQGGQSDDPAQIGRA